MLGFSFSLLRCKGSENQASTDRTPSNMKTPPAKSFFPCMSGMSLCPAFRHRLTSLWHRFFGTIALMEFVLKIRANSSAPLVSLPANEAMHVPWPRVCKLWQLLGAQFFGTIALMKFVLKNPCQQQCILSVAPCQRSYTIAIHRPTFANHLKSLGRTVFRDNRIDGICVNLS